MAVPQEHYGRDIPGEEDWLRGQTLEEGGERLAEKEEMRDAEWNEKKNRSTEKEDSKKEDGEREDAEPDREELEPRKGARAERGGEPKPATALRVLESV
ncbi:hypothetical protein NDU88_004363 [Pleurodeles waltl]|uniref:Uncharacterized protein n=1 Tax=Pleurodeles waltl TaxID=8319 RepID=A0AAV7W4S4_PLEWA|nr:hypothetical protein NDU88_004363 [Pleurodeles waltl]